MGAKDGFLVVVNFVTGEGRYRERVLSTFNLFHLKIELWSFIEGG